MILNVLELEFFLILRVCIVTRDNPKKITPRIKIFWKKMKLFHEFTFQVIVITSWVFSIIFNIPKFLVRTFDNQKNHCVQTWPKKWMIKAYSLAWLFLVVVSVGIMIVLYSKVVYTLWCKPNDGNPLNYQQRVS